MGGTDTLVRKYGEGGAADNTWHHIAGVYTGSDGHIYIDGQEVPLSRDDPDPGGTINNTDT